MSAFPNVVPFEGLAQEDGSAFYGGAECFYEVLGFRRPRKGEFYLSGAVVAAYRAKSDLAQEFHVVRPTYYARRVTSYERGREVTS